MTLAAALVAARRRTLRPERYTRVAGVVVAFFVIEVALRLLANLYLARVLAAVSPPAAAGLRPSSGPAAMWFFARVNVAWCALFAGSVSAMIVYRGIARTVDNLRLRYFPIGRFRLLMTALKASLRSVPAIAPFVLALAAWLDALTLGSGAASAQVLLLLLPGIGGFLALMAVAWLRRAQEGHLELIEVALLMAMMLANPDFRVDSGVPRLLLFGAWSVDPSQPWILLLVPVLGTAVCALAILVSSLPGRTGGRPASRGRTRGRRTVLVFYRSRIPVGLFAASYAMELPVILAGPIHSATVRTVVLVMLAARLLWFTAFLFRTEQEIGAIIRAPSEVGSRLSFYRPAALAHGLLCAAPLLLYLLRFFLAG